MLKRDRIFQWACGLSGAGVVFAILGYDLSLLFFVAAYLLLWKSIQRGARTAVVGFLSFSPVSAANSRSLPGNAFSQSKSA